MSTSLKLIQTIACPELAWIRENVVIEMFTYFSFGENVA
jgi:hypothetical protein